MIRLLPDELPLVTQYVYSLCSITLETSKAYLIEGRLGPIAEAAGCRNFHELIQKAKSDASGVLRRKIVDEITTQETFFFRDTSPFDLLRFKIIPDLIDARTRAGSRQPIRIWSAACSTGQEICSIAIVLSEVLGDLSRYDIRLLGTDISDHAVAKASAGIFGQLEVARGLSEASRARHFVPDPGGWKIRDELRAMMTFKKWNLTQDLTPLGKFDIIFCRNVAIYFSDTDRALVFNRMEQRLEPGGYLIIGSMESLSGICPQFESKRHQRAVYYQVKGNDLSQPTSPQSLSALSKATSPANSPFASRVVASTLKK
jgi:chemotaxis protein methyltransferase CheR